MTNCGFSEEDAKQIEANYNELYKESLEWKNTKLNNAAKNGYIECAFGLKVRTPILKQVVFGSDKTPYEAQAEGRTAGNALGQSWGLLNNRAQNEFMQRVYESKYRLDIHPVAAIHDATYYLIREGAEVVKFVNDNLIDCMQWQKHPDITHEKVHLGGELDVFSPNWSTPITLPNNASIEEILRVVTLCGESEDGIQK